MTRIVLGVATAAAVALSMTGCDSGFAVHGLQIHQDHRLRFVSPSQRSTVRLPAVIRWRIRGFRPGAHDVGSSPRFVIFVDTTPMPPGQSLRWVGRNDETCKPNPRCPDTTYLNERNVYTTSATSFTLARLPAQGSEDNGAVHDLTIVLLDADGRRSGESAFTLSFKVHRNS